MSDKKKEIFAPYVSVEDDLPKYGAEIVFRDEQKDAIDRAYKHLTKPAGKDKARQYLWNAKMRFGKTICALELARKLGVRTALIVTHRPVVDKGWHEDFEKVFNPARLKALKDDFLAPDHEYEYGSRSLEKEEGLNFPQLTAFAAKENCHGVYFVSMQYLALAEVVGGKNTEKQKRDILEFPWDMVIVDEAHEGTQTERGQNVLAMLAKPKTQMLHLSGTPFNLYDDFEDGEVYNWDYVKEQTAKKKWDPARGPNPYLILPRMNIFTYDLGKLVVGKNAVFSFAEFFRTKSGQDCPAEEQGKFVHEDWVRTFLDKLCEESETSNYPFSTDAYRLAFNHTLWVVPGVKEAKALERLLKEHDVFSNFEVVNVAGDSDEDEARANALDGLRKKITGHGRDTYTITLSCGRLTTGVTVKEWTAVFYLKGSENTSAATYMQTIFRTQSPYVFEDKEDGVRKYKANCYVFDFAPDRSLRMLAETAKFSTLTQKEKLNAKNVGSHDKDIQKMKDFLKFCPVISLDGTMQEFDAERLFTKLNEVYIDRVVRNGFNDNSLYDVQALLELDAGKLNELGDVIALSSNLDRPPRAKPLPAELQMAQGGLTGKKGKPDGDDDLDGPDDDAADDEEKLKKKARRDERDRRIKIIRGLALRVPLMMFGAEVTSDSEEITRENFTEKIDGKSWEEFMPRGVSKADFNKIRTAFNQTIFTGAGKKIRRLAREADDMTVTDRIQRIAEIFGTFHNPDKETVLTPWRVVNMHMSDTIGGYCFFDESFKGPVQKFVPTGADGKLFEYVDTTEPRFVDRKGVTDQVFFDRAEGSFDLRSKILEINSKTGLYPLYVAYTLFRARKADFEKLDLIEDASKYSVEEEHAIWDDILLDNIYVVCNTEMAARITKRTLVGFRDVGDERVNIKAIKLVEEATGNREKLIKELKRPGFWHEGAKGEDMKFNAVVGNPPYQVMTAKTGSEKNGQATRKNVFQKFQMVADDLEPNFVSLIYPGGRWIHRSGKGMEEFGLKQINDLKLAKVVFYPDSKDVFESVDLPDGISIVFKDRSKTSTQFEYVYRADGKIQDVMIKSPGDRLIALNPTNDAIVGKVEKFVASEKLQFLSERILPRSLFGIESEFVELNPKKVKPLAEGYKLGANEIKLYTNDKAGKAGRSQWYVANRSVITKDKQCYIDQWKVVVSSANAGGQKRDSQLAIIDNHSAFGRSRVALGSFKTKTEAENFYRFCCTALVRFMFLMTDEALTSLGKKVPDLMDYTAKNKLVDFSQDLDGQLNKLVGLTADEVSYIKGMIRPLAS